MIRGAGRSGVLIVDKAEGMTSFDVVTLVRRVLRVRRVGHGGTLDPGASGVLPILVGEATKLAPYLLDHEKEYMATVRLGVTTDTLDTAGRVLATAPVPPLTRGDLEAACAPFVGRTLQVPPMYSALHHQGRRLYELAREGLEVERPPREIVVHALAVVGVALPAVTLRIVCGRGTYVRALAADLGRALGCGGAVERLVRTRVGAWALADAVPVAALHERPARELWEQMRPSDSALGEWPEVRLERGPATAFGHGQAVRVHGVLPGPEGLVRVYGDGVFLGVGERVATPPLVRPVRLLHADPAQPPAFPA